MLIEIKHDRLEYNNIPDPHNFLIKHLCYQKQNVLILTN